MQLSLFELNGLIKKTLDFHLPSEIWVVAEIGEFNHGHQGHAYLDLIEKKENQIIAKIKANIWSYSYQVISGRFEKVTGQRLSKGMRILALVKVTFHEHYGISLNIKDIDPNFTLGERARMRMEIIERLTKESLLDKNKKLNLPRLPQHIAVISSANAAGFGDFIDQLQNNNSNYFVQTKLFPAVMQGNDGAESIISAVNLVQSSLKENKYDLIVIIRGGGAQSDLDCFDDYNLAVAIANAEIPVVTGIGHERDETIADLVAHTKMKTPTAVAEFILQGFRVFEEVLKDKSHKLLKIISNQIKNEENKINKLSSNFKLIFRQKLISNEELLNNKQHKIKNAIQNHLKINELQLNNIEKTLILRWKNFHNLHQEKFNQFGKDLNNLNPKSFFLKGYSKSEINAIPLNQHENPEAGDILITYSLLYKINSEIKKVENG